jgi:hypothetical protein
LQALLAIRRRLWLSALQDQRFIAIGRCGRRSARRAIIFDGSAHCFRHLACAVEALIAIFGERNRAQYLEIVVKVRAQIAQRRRLLKEMQVHQARRLGLFKRRFALSAIERR